MAYLSKLSDLDQSLNDLDSEQIYIPKALLENDDFKVDDLCELLNQSKSTVISLKKKLQQYGLIEEVQVGNNQPNRIYLTDKLVHYMGQGERL